VSKRSPREVAPSQAPLAVSEPPTLDAQYPHVDGIADWRAQQSIRLLWDRSFDLEARLQAAEATNKTLVEAANDHQAQITLADRKASEALAGVQLTSTETTGIIRGSGARNLKDDHGLGQEGCAAAGANGDIGPFAGNDCTVTNAGKVVCGVGTEWASLLAAVGPSNPTNDATRAANREEFLNRVVWHLNQAGFASARYGGSGTEAKYNVLFDAVDIDGSLPIRQFAYRVLDYSIDDCSIPSFTVMVCGGQTPGTITTPDAGTPD